jgi:hypothetical protein
MAGAWVSLTVTVNVQVPVLLEASVAVHVTVVVPFGKVDPDGGAHATVAPGQLSLADAEKLTTAEHRPESLDFVTLAGQVAVGGVLSTTVTVA